MRFRLIPLGFVLGLFTGDTKREAISNGLLFMLVASLFIVYYFE